MPLVQLKPIPAARKRSRIPPKLIRHAVMAFFFVFLLHVAYDHQVAGGGPRGTPSVEAYCPFGGLENLYYFLTTGGYIRRIQPSAMILFGALVLLTLLFSRGFCGWVCPFGSVQEWLGMLGRRIFRKRYNPDGSWVRRLAYFKYVVLIAIISLTWHVGTLVFRDYDPFLAFFHLGHGTSEMPWAYAILGVVLIGSLKFERFFCRFACPLGAVLGVLGRAGLTKIRRDEADCKSCNLCQQKCHAHVNFLSATTIRDAECNHCLDCVVDCPRPNVLQASGLRWRFTHAAYAVALIAGLFGFIATSKVAAYWQTKPGMPSFKTAAGKADPEAIMGWMTLGDVSGGYGISLDELYRLGGVPSNIDPATPMNRIARRYNIAFEPDRMRDVVRSLVQGAPLPKKQSREHSGEGQEIRGYMTLNEISSKTGVPKEYILNQVGAPTNTDPRKPVREWIHAAGKSMEDVRQAVAKYRSETRK